MQVKRNPQELKIVFFTNKCSHGAELLTAMQQHEIQLEAIFIEKKSQKDSIGNLKKTLKRHGVMAAFRMIFRAIRKKIIPHDKPPWFEDAYYENFTNRIIQVENFNDENCQKHLSDLAPDLIVLGGSRILRRPIIRIPKIGILNAHPGLLPRYRGVDVIAWAILNHDDVGVTVHIVDTGIDTGSICKQEIIPIQKGDTIETLKIKAEKIAGKLMAEVILAIMKDRNVPKTENPIESGKQFYRMDAKTLRLAQKALSERVKSR